MSKKSGAEKRKTREAAKEQKEAADRRQKRLDQTGVVSDEQVEDVRTVLRTALNTYKQQQLNKEKNP
jgi:multidrug resistance efflux pump